MRSVTYSMGVSLDGYIVGPDGDFNWTAPDEEVFRSWIDEIREVGVHLLGRRLYETMLYWETADQNSSLDEREMEYLYSDSAGHHFMDSETFDQVTLSDEVIGEQMAYLLPNTTIRVDLFDGNPVGIELPNTVTLKVVETQPGMKGATASASYKPATLETGLQVMVPQFIEAGTRIKVDTRDNTYLERA
jgi:elongation factor P